MVCRDVAGVVRQGHVMACDVATCPLALVRVAMAGWGGQPAPQARGSASSAEGVGFEPTMRLPPHSGFQDGRRQPGLALESPELLASVGSSPAWLARRAPYVPLLSVAETSGSCDRQRPEPDGVRAEDNDRAAGRTSRTWSRFAQAAGLGHVPGSSSGSRMRMIDGCFARVQATSVPKSASAVMITAPSGRAWMSTT